MGFTVNVFYLLDFLHVSAKQKEISENFLMGF